MNYVKLNLYGEMALQLIHVHQEIYTNLLFLKSSYVMADIEGLIFKELSGELS